MTKNVLLKVALAAALAAPVVVGLSSSASEAPPELGQGPRAEGPREPETRRFRRGAPEVSSVGAEGRRERPVVAAQAEPREGRGVRGERGPRGSEPRAEREARGPRGSEPRAEREARFAAHLRDELSLTPEQAEQVQAAFAQFREGRGAFRALPPEERRAALEDRRARLDAELAEILTPEQQTRMAELRAERPARVEARSRRGGPRGGEDARYVNDVDTRGI